MPAFLYDTNVWLALVFPAHAHHGAARALFAEASARSPACFCRATQQGFLRLAVTPAILKACRADDLTNADALNVHDSLMRMPRVVFMEEPPGLQARWHRLASMPSASPKVWMDAYLAAFAIGHKMELVTLDSGFRRYEKDALKLRLLAP